MSKREESEKLYNDLARAYQSPHFPSKEERNEAVVVLTTLLYHKVDKKAMIDKIQAFGIIHGHHKSKVTALINNRFWEHEVSYGVKPKRFKEED